MINKLRRRHYHEKDYDGIIVYSDFGPTGYKSYSRELDRVM
jgi:hypothetical protein